MKTTLQQGQRFRPNELHQLHRRSVRQQREYDLLHLTDSEWDFAYGGNLRRAVLFSAPIGAGLWAAIIWAIVR